MTRPYNSTPHLEDDGPDGEECGRCPYCDGTGYVTPDPSDEFDRQCDEAHERAVDREAGL